MSQKLTVYIDIARYLPLVIDHALTLKRTAPSYLNHVQVQGMRFNTPDSTHSEPYAIHAHESCMHV